MIPEFSLDITEERLGRKDRPRAGGRPDDFMTPPRALGPILPHLRAWEIVNGRKPVIWEPAAGSGNLSTALRTLGYCVIASDVEYQRGGPMEARERGIRVGPQYSFLNWQAEDWDVIVSNPPFSIKTKWLARCYQLGKPWALLMPPDALSIRSRQVMYEANGLDLTFVGERIAFETPTGKKSSPQFEAIWYRWKIGPAGNEFTTLPPFLDGLEQQNLEMG